jgi:hypothetical protein
LLVSLRSAPSGGGRSLVIEVETRNSALEGSKLEVIKIPNPPPLN